LDVTLDTQDYIGERSALYEVTQLAESIQSLFCQSRGLPVLFFSQMAVFYVLHDFSPVLAV
jgi:hypothetical protein